MSEDSIIIYTDGACSGNPGPGGWGSIVILNPEKRVVELGGGEAATTNNRMEMTGILEALRYCLSSDRLRASTQLQIYTDSVYVIRGITQWIFGWKKRGWKNAENEEVSNRDIWIQLDEVVTQVSRKLSSKIKWSFVKGHSGVPGNERCDVISVAFSKHDYISLYNGSSENYIFDVNVLPEERPLPEMKGKAADKEAKTAWYLSYVNGVLTRHETWRECEAVVKGRPAKFKKVTSADEEAQVKKSWGIG